VNSTSIEWCNRPETRGLAAAKTWNPIRARLKGAHSKARSGTFCTRISPGCQHCYASTINKRFGNGLEFTVPNLEKVEFFVDERILEEPLKQKKPCTIFVGDMFDLFHEAIPDEFIDAVVWVAIEADWHVVQFLTKRAQRMQSYFKNLSAQRLRGVCERFKLSPRRSHLKWPFPNLWLGVSIEDQQRHDERVPLLQNTPAAVRFLSVEPQLEDIRLAIDTPEVGEISTLRGFDGCDPPISGIDWVICGGESGPGARPFNLAWAESLLTQSRAAGVPFFMKQVGSHPVWKKDGTFYDQGATHVWHDRKGGNPAEWPEHLRVREFPTIREAVSA